MCQRLFCADPAIWSSICLYLPVSCQISAESIPVLLCLRLLISFCFFYCVWLNSVPVITLACPDALFLQKRWPKWSQVSPHWTVHGGSLQLCGALLRLLCAFTIFSRLLFEMQCFHLCCTEPINVLMERVVQGVHWLHTKAQRADATSSIPSASTLVAATLEMLRESFRCTSILPSPFRQ